MIVGYARTSTIEQVAGFEAQQAELERAGCERIFKERVSSVDVFGSRSTRGGAGVLPYLRRVRGDEAGPPSALGGAPDADRRAGVKGVSVRILNLVVIEGPTFCLNVPLESYHKRLR